MMQAKRESVPFVAGAPLVMRQPPPLPGYGLLPGRSLYLYSGYTCPGSIVQDILECVLPLSLEEARAYCDADPVCKGFMYKPGELQ